MSQLSIADLFLPAPSGVGGAGAQSNVVPTSAPAGSWYAQILQNANTLGLNTTAWQSGSPARTILAILSVIQSQQDAMIAGMAQGGFLDFAASGTVTYVDTQGHSTTSPVSPDPSIPSQNPHGVSTWIDILADSVYNVQRVGAQAAAGSVAIVNTSGTTPPTYGPGLYHVQNSNNQATYSNVAGLTIGPSPVIGTTITSISAGTPITVTTSTAHGLTTGQAIYITGAVTASNANGFWLVTVTSTTAFTLTGSVGGTGGSVGTVYGTATIPFSADLIGPNYSASTGQINTAVTTNNGVSVWNFGAFVGVPFESNLALAARCRLKLQSLSPNGASGAYQYFALTANQILQASTPSRSLAFGNITRAQVTSNPNTGIVTTTIANSNVTPSSAPTTGTPQVPGITNFPISAASNTNPITITANGHGLTAGQWVTISGVLGNTNADGVFAVQSPTTNTFQISANGSGTYVGGGQIDGGDLGQVDSILQANCVPDNAVAVTQSALIQAVAITGSVSVPFAQVQTYQTNLQASLAAYFQNLAIGGLLLTSGFYGLPIDVVIGLIFDAGKLNNAPTSFVINISNVLINGSSADLVFSGTNYVACLYPYPSNVVVAGV